MTPLPWLQFAPMQSPQLADRPSPLQSLMQLGQAGVQRVQANRGPGINPPARKFPTMSQREIDRSAGDAANRAAGTPPPVPTLRRRFPNPQQQMQLDMMR